MDGRARLARRGGAAGRRGALIGQAFAAAVAGALFGPVLGGVASIAGTGWTFGAVAVGLARLVAWAAATPAATPGEAAAALDARPAVARPPDPARVWLVVLPALLFGTLGVLGPLRLDGLGFGAVAIGAVFSARRRSRPGTTS